MADKLYSMLPGIAEDFYADFISGDRSEELFVEYSHLKELCSRIKEKLAQSKITEDGIIDATAFVKLMEDVVLPNVSADAEKFYSLKVFW